MIVQCPDCSTRYELDDSRVPPGRIRVRCARCRYVFPIEASTAQKSGSGAVPQAEDQGATPRAWTSGDTRRASRPVAVEPMDVERRPNSKPEAEPMAGLESTRIEDAPTGASGPGLDLVIERPTVGRDAAPEPSPELSPRPSPTATMTREPAAVEEDPTVRKARRLARALVSDILVYNRDKRDKALAEGTLVQALGQEIKKSWELYKERVTPEVANSTNHFKDALNEILADGKKIF
jgi:predicted Zn finger-like uncharacterized protein